MQLRTGVNKSTALRDVVKELEVLPNSNLNAAQAEAGLVAKTQVRYRGFSFVTNVWRRNGRLFVSVPSQKGTKNFFNLINLDRDVSDYILDVVQKHLDGRTEDITPWYLEYQPINAEVTSANSNEALGIKEIIFDGNLSYNQKRAGMLCKVTIETPIGSFNSLSVFKSKFTGLYSTTPQEGERREGQRGVAGYVLDRAVIAQVLKHINTFVDWEAPDEVLPELEATTEGEAEANVAKAMENAGFNPTDGTGFSEDEIFNDNK